MEGKVGNTFSSAVAETAGGIPIPPIGPLVFASDNPAVVSVDPSTGKGALVSAGTANVSVIDQGNGLTDTVVVTVAAEPPPPPPPTADKLTLTLSLD